MDLTDLYDAFFLYSIFKSPYFKSKLLFKLTGFLNDTRVFEIDNHYCPAKTKGEVPLGHITSDA